MQHSDGPYDKQVIQKLLLDILYIYHTHTRMYTYKCIHICTYNINKYFYTHTYMENHTLFQKQDYIEHTIWLYAIFHSLGCFKYISTAKSTYIPKMIFG